MKSWYEIGRVSFAFIFLMGAIANLVIVINNPEIYSGFADYSILAVYHSLWANLVMPNLQLLIASVAFFELILSILLLTRALFVKIGLYLGAAFMLFLFPFWWSGGAIINLVFAVFLLKLASRNYPRSLLNMLFRGILSKR